MNLDDLPYAKYSHKNLIMQNSCIVSYQLMGARTEAEVERASIEVGRGAGAEDVPVAVSAAASAAVTDAVTDAQDEDGDAAD